MENNLAVIIKDSGLEETKANFLLTNFQNYFEIASDWEIKAKNIVVNNETQKAEMEMARAGRLFLREKRIAIEKSRKELKEQSLREGKAIDGIANVLKALIEPIEEYLDKQEHFVEIKQKEEAERLRIVEEKRLEDERLAKEKAYQEEQERIRLENEKLKKEAEKKENERLAREEEINRERLNAEAEKKVIEEKALKDKEKADRAILLDKQKAEAEKRAIEEKARLEKEKAEKARKLLEQKAEAEKKKLIVKQEKLKAELAAKIECPYCHKKFNLNK